MSCRVGLTRKRAFGIGPKARQTTGRGGVLKLARYVLVFSSDSLERKQDHLSWPLNVVNSILSKVVITSSSLLLTFAVPHAWSCGQNAVTLIELPFPAGSTWRANALNAANQMTGYRWSAAGYVLGTNGILSGWFARGTNLVTLTVTGSLRRFRAGQRGGSRRGHRCPGD